MDANDMQNMYIMLMLLRKEIPAVHHWNVALVVSEGDPVESDINKAS